MKDGTLWTLQFLLLLLQVGRPCGPTSRKEHIGCAGRMDN